MTSYRFGPKEIEAVMKEPPKVRLAYFVSRVADWGEIWSLKNADGWVLAGAADREIVPAWPFREYAQKCAVGAWVDCAPGPISVEVFLERWIPGLKKDKRVVSVFPTQESSGMMLEPDQIAELIREELKRLE